MSATLLPADGSLAKGLAALERLLASEDERVALKAAELLLHWHPDVQKRKPGAVEAETSAETDLPRLAPLATPSEPEGVLTSPTPIRGDRGVGAVAPTLNRGVGAVAPTLNRGMGSSPDSPTPPLANIVKKKVLLAPFLSPPPPHRSTDPLPQSFLESTKPLTSFLRPPKSAKDTPG